MASAAVNFRPKFHGLVWNVTQTLLQNQMTHKWYTNKCHTNYTQTNDTQTNATQTRDHFENILYTPGASPGFFDGGMMALFWNHSFMETSSVKALFHSSKSLKAKLVYICLKRSESGRIILNHLILLLSFYVPWKHWKTSKVRFQGPGSFIMGYARHLEIIMLSVSQCQVFS